MLEDLLQNVGNAGKIRGGLGISNQPQGQGLVPNLGPQGAPMGPQQGAPMQGQQGAPDPTTNFDVEQNPMDKQVMTDAIGYAIMLKKMPQKKRDEEWPKIVKKLEQTNPKVRGLLDPSLPPNDEALDELLNGVIKKAPGGAEGEDPDQDLYSRILNEDQPQGQANVGAPTAPTAMNAAMDMDQPGQAMPASAELFPDNNESEEPQKAQKEQKSKLSAPLARKSKERIIDAEKDLGTMSEVYKKWNTDFYTLKGVLKNKYLSLKEWVTGDELKGKNQKFVREYQMHKQRVEQMMLIWRKFITGVAGGEKEMKKIESTTLNMNLSPTQAKAARDLLFYKLVRDRYVHNSLLSDGMTIKKMGKDKYSNEFSRRRAQFKKDWDSHMERLKKANPDAPESALYEYKVKEMMKGGRL